MDARNFTRALISFAVGAVAFAGACNRLTWERKSEDRRARIHHHVSRFAEHDATGTVRMESTFNRMRQRRCYHKDHLEQTSALVRKEMESDERRWGDERSHRRAFAHRQWNGHPDTIPNTWARMVY
jgi:hypothetical protein